MNPIRIINQAAGKGLNLSPIFGGAPVDRLVEMGELHGLSEEAMQFALAKYNKDRKGLLYSAAALKRKAATVATREGWKCKDQSVLDGAAIVALMQHVEPVKMGHICLTCNGTGGAVNSPCKPCDGGGYRSKPDVLYAAILGISDTSYRKTWERRVAYLYNLAGNWEKELWRVWAKSRDIEG